MPRQPIAAQLASQLRTIRARHAARALHSRSRRSPSSAHAPSPPAPSSRWPPRSVILSCSASGSSSSSPPSSTPPLLDDADATHAQAAQPCSHTATGSPSTSTASATSKSRRSPTGSSPSASASSAQHLRHPPPAALAILGLALLGYAWARRAFNASAAAFYTALGILTSAGVFLFTRVFIPDVLLSLLLAFALYASSAPSTRQTRVPHPRFRRKTAQSLHPTFAIWPYASCGRPRPAVLTKGLVAIVFLFAATVLYLFSPATPPLARLKPFTGLLLFLAIAAPWHILAGLRNTGRHAEPGSRHSSGSTSSTSTSSASSAAASRATTTSSPATSTGPSTSSGSSPGASSPPPLVAVAWHTRDAGSRPPPRQGLHPSTSTLAKPRLAAKLSPAQPWLGPTLRTRILLLLIFSALVLVFFSLSTNQEYYTFPAYLPLFILVAAALAHLERNPLDRTAPPAHLRPRRLHRPRPRHRRRPRLRPLDLRATSPSSPTSAISSPIAASATTPSPCPHFFDLTGPSFAALRLPAALALIAFPIGPPSPGPPRAPPPPRRHHHHRRSPPPSSSSPRTSPSSASPPCSPRTTSPTPSSTSKPPTRSPPTTRSPPLRRPGLRLLHPLLPRPSRLARRRPLHLHALRQHLPRRAAHLPHPARPLAQWGTRPAQNPLRPARKARRRRPAPRPAPDLLQRNLRQSPPHRPPARSPDSRRRCASRDPQQSQTPSSQPNAHLQTSSSQPNAHLQTSSSRPKPQAVAERPLYSYLPSTDVCFSPSS